MEGRAGYSAAAGQSGGVVYSDAPQRDPQVYGELMRLQGGIETLGKSVEHLVQRLASVTRVEPPSPITADKNSVSEVVVQLADQIRTSRVHVLGLNATVESLLQRLEL